MNTRGYRHVFRALVALAFLLAACAPAATPTVAPPPEATPTQAAPTPVPATPTPTEPCLLVGILHVGSITDAGYNEAHRDAVEVMKQNIPCIEVISAENVPESADAERMMENMIRQGAKFVIPASYGYLDYALKVAEKHPDVIFEHPSGWTTAENLGTYWAESTQAFYLMGIAAGKMTKSNKIGFVAAMPIGVLLANINGFHLGARSVNPEVETHVVFTGGWLDPGKEATATNALIDEGVDVVTMVVDSPITVVQTAETRDIYSMGYHYVGVAKFAPKGWITGIGFTWGPFFTRVAQQIMDGTWKSEAVMGDLASDMITLAPFGSAVPQEVIDLVNTTKEAFTGGELNVFEGPIKDNEGVLRVPEGEVLGADQLYQIDWLAEGVIGTVK